MFSSHTKMEQKPDTLRIDLMAPLLTLSKMNVTITGGPPVDARPNMKPLTKKPAAKIASAASVDLFDS